MFVDSRYVLSTYSLMHIVNGVSVGLSRATRAITRRPITELTAIPIRAPTRHRHGTANRNDGPPMGTYKNTQPVSARSQATFRMTDRSHLSQRENPARAVLRLERETPRPHRKRVRRAGAKRITSE